MVMFPLREESAVLDLFEPCNDIFQRALWAQGLVSAYFPSHSALRAGRGPVGELQRRDIENVTE